MTPAQAEAVLFDLPRFADRGASAYAPGLDRVRALLRAMGDPHIGLPAVHVAGTNGKGSTASFVAAIGTASGRRVGLHTSPRVDLSVSSRVICSRTSPLTPVLIVGGCCSTNACARAPVAATSFT